MAQMTRTIRLEITVDPDEYARAHGVAAYEALDHATKRVEHMAASIATNDPGVLTVARTNVMGGVIA